MDYGVRALIPGDAAAIAALIRLAFSAQSIVTDPLPSALLVTTGDIVAHLRSGGGAAAEANCAIVGCALWTEQEGALYLSRLAVAPAWRDQGRSLPVK
jgi:predicted N-acetyltransferase YhbS